MSQDSFQDCKTKASCQLQKEASNMIGVLAQVEFESWSQQSCHHHEPFSRDWILESQPFSAF